MKLSLTGIWTTVALLAALNSAKAEEAVEEYADDYVAGDDDAEAEDYDYSSSSYNITTKSGHTSYYKQTGPYGSNYMVESENTYYDGYQQAWRYLGTYVQCGNPSDRYNEKQNSHDSGDNNNYVGNNWCQRYLMWAMYIDPNYSSGGIGEYSFYNTQSGSWDETACNYHGNGRCAPMDCHLTDTSTWKLLGVFKEATYFGNDAFFEQLFKHEGVCVWNDEDTYEFMSNAREQYFSEGCIQTSVRNDDYSSSSSSSSSYLYIDLKPTFNGNFTYALYTDEICKTEYEGTSAAVDTVAQNMGMLYGSYLKMWNDAMEIYKVCQPCMAYNLQNAGSSYSNGKYSYYNKYNKNYNKNYNYNNGNNNNNNNNGNYGEGNYNYDEDPNEGYFKCEDDADYTNVNQCMKFRTHSDLEVATWEDLVMATNQGGILQINVSGTVFGSERITRDQEKYWDTVRRNEYQKKKQKEQAEAAAQQAALQAARAQRGHAAMFMTAGIVAVALSLASLYGAGRRRGSRSLSEPLYNDDGQYA